MSFSSRYDRAKRQIVENGGTPLEIAGITDGQFLKRVGLTITSAAGGGGGTTYNFGAVELDFGAAPGSNEASVAVTGQTSILGTSKVEAFIMADDTTTDHTAEDHRYVQSLGLSLTCGSLIAGTGFTIFGRSPHKLTGKFALRWKWAD